MTRVGLAGLAAIVMWPVAIALVGSLAILAGYGPRPAPQMECVATLDEMRERGTDIRFEGFRGTDCVMHRRAQGAH